MLRHRDALLTRPVVGLHKPLGPNDLQLGPGFAYKPNKHQTEIVWHDICAGRLFSLSFHFLFITLISYSFHTSSSPHLLHKFPRGCRMLDTVSSLLHLTPLFWSLSSHIRVSGHNRSPNCVHLDFGGYNFT